MMTNFNGQMLTIIVMLNILACVIISGNASLDQLHRYNKGSIVAVDLCKYHKNCGTIKKSQMQEAIIWSI